MKAHSWQLVSLKLSKALKKAGYPQEGLWWWGTARWNDCTCGSQKQIEVNRSCEFDKKDKICVAPTVAELGERLPNGYFTRKCSEGFLPSYYNGMGLVKEWLELLADTEANARAKMWLYLKKEDKL